MTDAAVAQPDADRLDAAYARCFETVRAGDRDAWLASLFWPEAARPHVHALLAFSLEITRVREAVTQPTLGEIRLQWWRDVLVEHNASGNPIAQALLATSATFNLDKDRLLALIEAHSFDLYDDPMPSETGLENYLRDTSGTVLDAIARVLSPGRVVPPCVEAAARAWGLTNLLRNLPYQIMRGQLFIPLDLLERLKLPPETVLAHRNSPGLGLVLQTLRARVRMHLHAMQDGLDHGGPAVAACLPAFLCKPYLRAMERPMLNPFETPIELPQWRRQWVLWRAARRLP